MMEHARGQLAPRRGPLGRAIRWLGYDVVLAHPALVRLAALLQPVARPFLPARLRRVVPLRGSPLGRLPRVTESRGPVRGTVALLAGCVQDRWFHEVNRATIRVLARDGWRVIVPPRQRCCGALAAHDGRLETARRLARANLDAFAGAEHVVANAAGCGAHLASYDDLVERGLPVRDLLSFLHEEGRPEHPRRLPRPMRVAYHDACHALRVLGVRAAPRALLDEVDGVDLVEIAHGDRCCGAAGTYHVTQPEMSARLRDERVAAILATGADVVASANPGCTLQLKAGLGSAGFAGEVLHPVQLLDLADVTAERS
jgi:glycolate oxidase iron-sulfur subunit